MSNRWKQKDIPHKGWTLISVIDVREDGQSEEETDYENCMMCGKEKIRYVHIVDHPEVYEDYRVGCVCSEHLTDDYVNPKRLEQKLRNRTSKRKNWIKKEWKRSPKGNYYINFEEHHLIIYKDKKTNKYKVKIGEIFGNKIFDTIEKAKVAVFNGIEYFKGKGKW
jgi:hypothetical protein